MDAGDRVSDALWGQRQRYARGGRERRHARGNGKDTFVFGAGFGHDTISDFTAAASAKDVIEFHDRLFADFAAVQAAQVGSDVVITVDDFNSVTLLDVTLASLTADDFSFL
jgi:Ca2+-binding RTX toxin-like protein